MTSLKFANVLLFSLLVSSITASCPCSFGSGIISCREPNSLTIFPEDLINQCPDLINAPESIIGIIVHNQEHLTELKPDSFVLFPNLVSIGFGFNHIQRIHDGAFKGLKSLFSLYLNGNNITVIDDGAFDDLTKVKDIELSENPFER